MPPLQSPLFKLRGDIEPGSIIFIFSYNRIYTELGIHKPTPRYLNKLYLRWVYINPLSTIFKLGIYNKPTQHLGSSIVLELGIYKPTLLQILATTNII
jgi:hypothetical protein